ncbi:hypothetical protein DSO57_1032981 [Entomophthora muscae]|uniref:Uncharacterized protein n=1 Tax=Entomophthora muscae TaxID=34485 RepID=A0ACC2T0I2_9FUNG|nr:hypothetical protein DSO57_1032981 [Entomophthora muscae]
MIVLGVIYVVAGLMEMIPLNLIPQSNINDSPVLMRRASIDDVRYYANVAGAAFCQAARVQNFTCYPYCTDTIAGTFSTPPTSKVQVLKTFYNPIADIKAYVATIPQRNEVVIAMATGLVQTNRIFILSALLTRLDIRHPLNNNTHIETNNVLVHAPLLHVARLLFAEYRATLQQEAKTGKTIVFTGHSVGAELGILSAIIAHQELNIPWAQIRYLGYGMVRIGNREFARWLNQQRVEATHVVNHNDKIVHLLANFNNYQHFGNEIFLTKHGDIRLCDNRYFEDPHCSTTEADPKGQDPHLKAFQTNFGLLC